jgi:hypothetical protein
LFGAKTEKGCCELIVTMATLATNKPTPTKDRKPVTEVTVAADASCADDEHRARSRGMAEGRSSRQGDIASRSRAGCDGMTSASVITLERVERAIQTTAGAMSLHPDLAAQIVPTLKRLEAERNRLLQEPEQFYEFHRKIYAQRGTTDGPRALGVAAGLGLNKQNMLALGDSDQITGTMKNLVNLGTSLGLEATPSFIAGNLAVLGYPGPHALQAMVSAVGTCGKAAC